MSRHSLVKHPLAPRPARRSSLGIALELFGLMLVGGTRPSRPSDRR